VVARPIFASVDRGDWRRGAHALTEADGNEPEPADPDWHRHGAIRHGTHASASAGEPGRRRLGL